MIKNYTTIDNITIKNLKLGSKKKIIRICDDCAREDVISYCDYNKAKKNRMLRGLDNRDVCRKCSYRYYSPHLKGRNMPINTRQKLSERAKARFKKCDSTNYLKSRVGNNNPNFCGSFRVNSNGYAAQYQLGSEILLHRKIMEDSLGKSLSSNEVVHHIDGNKLNNNISNLFLTNNSEHKQIHYTLEQVAFKAVQQGIISFNKSSKEYYINPSLYLEYLPVSLGFDDIAILQGKNICQSRLDVDISSEIMRDITRPIPLIASNMSSVTNADFCITLYNMGALGILHRAAPDNWIISETEKIARNCNLVAVSIGVGDDQLDLAKKLINVGANIVVIDIAHGYCDAVIQLGKRLRKINKDIKIIVGNTINTDMMYEVAGFADAVKIGIANGLACETKNTAGCTEKQFSAIYKFKELSKQLGLPIISDGGIRESGDFTKAILAGCNSVMAGSIFARCPESAAEVINIDGVDKKVYAGMASRHVQNQWRGGLKSGTCPEGKIVYLDIGENIEQLLERYSGALRSGITYVGAKNIKDAQQNVKFIKI